MKKIKVFLCDLTHTGQVVAANVMPLGIGLIAGHLLSVFPNTHVELFKYPDDLAARLEDDTPQIVGFSNYSWNLDISYKFAQRIKQASPETIIVFGGPNYGLQEEEVESFWQRYPLIDFYVVREGEVSFENLFHLLVENDFNIQNIKLHPDGLTNCHFLSEGKVVQTQVAPRIGDLGSLPSPYLLGLMDKFFDNVLIPMIHTTRGCPFACTFCSEGSKYYSKVSHRTDLADELEYIALKRGSIPDLIVTDANFGMYTQDREKALLIRDIQDRHKWPQRLIVSTGKNQKERIIEVADILNGTMSVAASLQSTDEEILKNIKRSNISIESLKTIVDRANSSTSSTYTELILGLPGDSKVKHEKSLRDVTNLGLGIVRMYQLILLPQTELNTPTQRKEYDMKTRFRINPRSFGKYALFGQEFTAVEHEEILISNSTLSFDDYMDCRELHLSIEILHNSSLFYELSALFRQFGLPWFELIQRVHEARHINSDAVSSLYRDYRDENMDGTFATQDELTEKVGLHIDGFLKNLDGTNEIAKGKARAILYLLNELHAVVYEEASLVIAERGLLTEQVSLYLSELETFSRCKKIDFLDTSIVKFAQFHYDFINLENSHFMLDPNNYFLDEVTSYKFQHSPDQVELIGGYLAQYGGNALDGLGRILMRANPRKLFRNYTCGVSNDTPSLDTKIKPDQALNVYGGFSVE